MKFSKTFVRAVAIILALLIVVSLVVGVIGSIDASAVASQSALNKLKDKQAALEQDKKEVQAQIDALDDKMYTALGKKAVLDEQVNITTAQIDNINEQIAEYEVLIVEMEEEIAILLEEEAARYQLYKERIRAMEENGTISYLSIVFGAKDWSDLLSRTDYIQEIMSYDESVYDSLVDARNKTEAAKILYEEAKAESEAKKVELVEKEELLKKEVAAAQAYIQELQNDLDAWEALEAEQAAQEKEILKQIEQMTKELEEVKTVVGTGSFIWPSAVSRRVTSPFGTRWHPVHGGYRTHYGIDIGGVGYGSNVLASDGGTVVTATYSSSYGNYVVISHGNGYRTLYAHMSELRVSHGQEVSQGQVIGLTGSTGVSNGPHIHFEIIKNGTKVDPLSFFSNYVKAWE